MKLGRITLREIRMPLVHPFETSFGLTTNRRILLVEVESQGAIGWGEVTANELPRYNEEWTDSAWLLIRDMLGPALLRHDFETASEVGKIFGGIRGHRMTRAGLETAVWDLEARSASQPLWRHIGGSRESLDCGVSIGIQQTVGELLDKIEVELAAGYKRIKIKIKPGWDVDVVAAVRKKFPSIKLMADANSAYSLADTDHLKRLDEFGLMMIEQPLAHDDIIDHSQLQPQLDTPICLDESILSAHHAEQAIRLGACRIINIKLGRVGGFAEAKRLHDLTLLHEIPVWCGGMLEAGIGRAHNIALSTLENFQLPGDVSASQRYWARDIIEPEVTAPNGQIAPPAAAGIGFTVDREYIDHLTVRQETLS